MPRFPAIIGPTAGGKSDLAIAVAHLLGGPDRAEIVTADAFQIYRGMDIGTAKPTPEECRAIAHHLIDIVGPEAPFTVADWLAAAERAIADIQARAKPPIVVGGTPLYIKALVDGLFGGPEPDPALRETLRAMGLPALRAELERTDPAAAARIHPNDERRTIRALEVFHQTGVPISRHQTQWDAGDQSGGGSAGRREDLFLIGLDWPAPLINPRINTRVRSMMDRGLLEETRALWSARRFGPQSGQALGYKQLIEHLEGRATLEEAVEQIKIETRRFAKNQRTWLKRLRATPRSVWIDAGSEPCDRWAGHIVAALSGRL